MRLRKETGLVPRQAAWRASAQTLALVAGESIVPTRVPEEETTNGYLRLTAHLLLAAQRTGMRTVGVSSALSGEGKTSAAINLAASLGRARGREGRVLLVDGDARKRTLSRLLARTAAARRSEPLLVATGFEGVDFMTAPEFGPGPSIHAPSAWRDTLEALSARYAQIVIDCPAVLADAEGVVLRECVDGIVLVVRAGQTTRATLRRAFGTVGNRVVGVVLNGSRESVPVTEGGAA